MVIKRLLLLFLILLWPASSFGASFSARVEATNVTEGVPFTLELSLVDARAKEQPNLTGVLQHFSIVGQAESQSYNYVNGTSSANQGVELTLVARAEGHFTIPSITLETSEGALKTEPIEMNVTKGTRTVPAPPQATGDEASPVSISATVDEDKPYQDQPVRYQILVTVFGAVTDIELEDFSVDHAVLDKNGQPKIFDVAREGRPAKLLEYDFVVTPLKPGPLTIPAPRFRGTVFGRMEMPNPVANGFGSVIAMMRQMGGHAFSLEGPTVSFDVKPPIEGVRPWLPLAALKLQDEWRGVKDAKVGEPLTRTLTFYAEGLPGSQLPNLESAQNHSDFKVYADKPTVGVDNGKPGERVKGWRRENYTLIPQKAGRLILPAIRTAWWNLSQKRIEYAEIPEKTLDVAEGAPPPPTAAPVRQDEPVKPPEPEGSPSVPIAPPDHERYILYGVIAFLAATILALMIWTHFIQRKMTAILKPGPAQQPVRETKVSSSESDLKTATTAEEMRSYLQNLAEKRWGAMGNAPFEKIIAAAPQKVRSRVQILTSILSEALYAGGTFDADAAKAELASLAREKHAAKAKANNSESLQDLNPN